MEIKEPSTPVLLGMIAGGAIVSILGMAYVGDADWPLWACILVVLLLLPFTAAIALAAGYVVSLWHDTSVEQPGYVYVKFLAAYAVSLAVQSLLPGDAWLVSAIVFMVMLMWLFQYVWWEALLMMIAIRFTQIALLAVLGIALAVMLG